jgi:hypothetical protein
MYHSEKVLYQTHHLRNMPIEIRELVIRAFVDSSSSTKKKLFKNNRHKAPEKIIQESLDQFSELIKKEKER